VQRQSQPIPVNNVQRIIFAEVEGDNADKPGSADAYYIAVYPMETPHDMDWTSIM
jgi:hypothetical protein